MSIPIPKHFLSFTLIFSFRIPCEFPDCNSKGFTNKDSYKTHKSTFHRNSINVDFNGIFVFTFLCYIYTISRAGVKTVFHRDIGTNDFHCPCGYRENVSKTFKAHCQSVHSDDSLRHSTVDVVTFVSAADVNLMDVDLPAIPPNYLDLQTLGQSLL